MGLAVIRHAGLCPERPEVVDVDLVGKEMLVFVLVGLAAEVLGEQQLIVFRREHALDRHVGEIPDAVVHAGVFPVDEIEPVVVCRDHPVFAQGVIVAGDVLDVADAVDLRLDGHDRRLDLRIVAEHGHAVFLDDLLIARGHVEHLEGDAGCRRRCRAAS